ncbi:hypothetical protein R5R35_010948 [Gryllus longicercus]|uniref:Calcyclin-binding protein n=1 Tax=Gryllus longicercus TaxID=2509291 RepID=A0AAN9VKY1_9ORTH
MSAKLDELKLDVAELNQLLASAERQKVKDILLIEIRKLETEITRLKEIENAKVSQAESKTNQTKPNRCYDVKLNNYAWDQSDKFVKIFVTLKNVHTLEQANISCIFTNRSMELTVRGLDNRNYILPISNLLDDLDVNKCYWKVKTDTVVVFMAKSKIGSSWSHMTSSDKKAKEPKLPKFDKNDDPSAGLMDMMKQMYEDGDDEMKRTIAKAWTESREKQMKDF